MDFRCSVNFSPDSVAKEQLLSSPHFNFLELEDLVVPMLEEMTLSGCSDMILRSLRTEGW